MMTKAGEQPTITQGDILATEFDRIRLIFDSVNRDRDRLKAIITTLRVNAIKGQDPEALLAFVRDGLGGVDAGLTIGEMIIAYEPEHLTRTASLAAQDQQVLALVEAARDAGDVLQSAASPSNLDPQYSDQIAALGERIGYGALMHGASALWRKSLGDLAGSEFAAGPCVSTAASRLARLDDALMPFRGETLPDAPSLAAQDGLVEALERCAQIVEQWNHRQNEKVDDIKYIVRNALSAIKGDKS